jgi:uncharacterized protein (DUF1684 family)
LSRSICETTLGIGTQFGSEQDHKNESAVETNRDGVPVDQGMIIRNPQTEYSLLRYTDNTQTVGSYSLLRYVRAPASETPFNVVHLTSGDNARVAEDGSDP